MAKQLSYQPLDNIGINGLNTQANPTTLDPSWLTKADNIVLRESGRISFRKGLKQNILANTAGTSSAPLKIGAIGELGTTIFAPIGTDMYTVDLADPDDPWTAASLSNITASDWQFVNFNNKIYAFQASHTPLEYSTSWNAQSTTTDPISGTNSFDPSCGMGYYGRLWVGGVSSEKDVVYYSDTLIGTEWRPEGADGTLDTSDDTAAGYVDLKKVWGTDEIIAITPFYGKLVIFGKNNIAIYKNPSDPNGVDFGLDEVIRGVGCASRDSVQAVGDDLLFLSNTGLRSLLRTTEKDKLPLTDLSVNIKDTLIRNISQSSNVKSTYVENEGVYIMSFVDLNITYVFDMKHITPKQAPRVTTWSFDVDREPSCLAYTNSKGFLIGQKKGSIATYEGYFDKDYSGSSVHTSHSYTGSFSTTWIDLGDSVVSSLLKKMKAIINGGAGTVVGVKWYKDFSQTPSKTQSFQLNPITTGIVSLFGASTSLYGTTTVTTTTAGSLVTGTYYTIKTLGTTNFTLVGASANTVGVTFKSTGAGTGTGTVESHTHSSTLHPNSCTYTPLYGLKEYNVPLTGSAKHLQIEMAAETNGYVASLQDMTLLYKQGKIR